MGSSREDKEEIAPWPWPSQLQQPQGHPRGMSRATDGRVSHYSLASLGTGPLVPVLGHKQR